MSARAICAAIVAAGALWHGQGLADEGCKTASRSDEHKRIFMVLHRGLTDVEMGFIDYLREASAGSSTRLDYTICSLDLPDRPARPGAIRVEHDGRGGGRRPTADELSYLRELERKEVAFEYLVCPWPAGDVVERMFEEVSGDGREVEKPAIVERIKSECPDLVYTWGTGVTKVIAGTADARQSTPDRFVTETEIPLVFTMVTYPVHSGIVRSRSSSEANVTGTSHIADLEVQLRYMHAYRAFDRIGLVYDNRQSNSRRNMRELVELSLRGIELDRKGTSDDEQGAARRARLEEQGYEEAFDEVGKWMVKRHRFEVEPRVIDVEQPQRLRELAGELETALEQPRRLRGLVAALKERAASVHGERLRGLVGELEGAVEQPARVALLVGELKRQVDRIYEKTLSGLVSELKGRVDFIYIGPDSTIGRYALEFTNAAIENCLPTFTAAEQELRKGNALMGLVTRYKSLGRFTGYKAEQILMRGIDPADIPIQTLKRFSLIVNFDVARKLGFYPPISLIKYAENVSGAADGPGSQQGSSRPPLPGADCAAIGD